MCDLLVPCRGPDACLPTTYTQHSAVFVLQVFDRACCPLSSPPPAFTGLSSASRTKTCAEPEVECPLIWGRESKFTASSRALDLAHHDGLGVGSRGRQKGQHHRSYETGNHTEGCFRGPLFSIVDDDQLHCRVVLFHVSENCSLQLALAMPHSKHLLVPGSH